MTDSSPRVRMVRPLALSFASSSAPTFGSSLPRCSPKAEADSRRERMNRESCVAAARRRSASGSAVARSGKRSSAFVMAFRSIGRSDRSGPARSTRTGPACDASPTRDLSANASAAPRPVSDNAIAETATRDVTARTMWRASRCRAPTAAVRRSRSSAVTCVTPTDGRPRARRRSIRCQRMWAPETRLGRVRGRRAAVD